MLGAIRRQGIVTVHTVAVPLQRQCGSASRSLGPTSPGRVRRLSSCPPAEDDAKMAKWNMPKSQANYAELSPMSFLKRVERVYPDHTAVVHGSKSFTWKQTAERCRRLASALTKHGISRGDTVAVIASNTPELNECHFGIPMTGAVILAINTRLDAATVAFSLEHSEASFLITDTEFAPMVRDALKILQKKIQVVDICDSEMPQYNTAAQRLSEMDYEKLLSVGDTDFEIVGPRDEWDPIALGYTSGTTGNPKGVVTHHRGAYLNSMSHIVGWDLGHHPKYLWSLPMFHCNGWCFPWTLAAVAGTSICLRKVTAEGMFKAIALQGATHMCGAPIVLNTLRNAPQEARLPFSHTVKIMTAAAPPPPSTLQAMQEQGFEVTHVYGLTETHGPAVICAWHPQWHALPLDQQAKLRSRQGVNYHVLEDVQVLNAETLKCVAADGETLGEVMFRGNVVMKGYLKNENATTKDLAGGWFHSGDIGVMHPNGYIELKDRSKDVIISGGENISSIEVEAALSGHKGIELKCGSVCVSCLCARVHACVSGSVCMYASHLCLHAPCSLARNCEIVRLRAWLCL